MDDGVGVAGGGLDRGDADAGAVRELDQLPELWQFGNPDTDLAPIGRVDDQIHDQRHLEQVQHDRGEQVDGEHDGDAPEDRREQLVDRLQHCRHTV